MNIAVVGMGIIGGSFCKAFKKYTDHYIIGINRTQSTLQQAFDCGAIDEMGNEESLSNADVVIMAVYPQATVEYIEKYGSYLKKGCIVTDSSGIKTEICPQMVALSKKFGFTFVGSHPMAGKETNGFSSADADLYRGASYIIVPCEADDSAVKILSDLAMEINFGQIKLSTPEEHDRMIAFTSQMPHILSNAFIKSPTALRHKGFSAGSYKDLTRVAWLNPQMWAELFLENRDNTLFELDTYIQNLSAYRDAIANNDLETLTALLEEGKRRKEEVDG